MRTKRLSTKFKDLVFEKYPNAGPNPCISGMKAKYYGKEAYTVMCGQYLYNLGLKLDTPEKEKIWDLAY